MSEDRKQRDRGATERDSTPAPDEGFLSRWTRRKREAIAPEQLANIDTRAVEGDIAESPRRDSVEPVIAKTDADMPPIETLDENSDYSPFLSPKVSQKLRSVALRKLFHMAAFNIRDGLDDYDEDFTIFEPLGDTITADMRHQMEREKEKEEQRLAKLADDESGEERTERSDDDREQTELASTDDAATEDESALDVESDDDGDDGDDSPRASENKA